MATVAMSVVYVLTTPIPEDGADDPTVKHVMKRNKWDNDDYVCRGLILKENSSNAITPDLSTEEPDNSLSMGDEHPSTIPETESDEVIKSSVEDLVPIPSESEGISDDTCDVPFCDNSPPLDVLNDHFEIFSDFNDDCTSSDDDSFENIDYVEASPLDSELVSLEEVKDDILREKLLNINLLIAKIESLNDNPTLDCVLKSPSPFPILVEDSDSFFEKSDTSLSYSDNSLPEFETFSDHTEETRSGSSTTHADNSLPEYDSFHFEIKPDQGELTSVVMKIFWENLVSDLEVSFPFRTRNKIFDPGIFFEVQSKRFLSRDIFSISFICNPLFPVIESLLPFSSENEDKVFNHAILSSNLLSHRGKITSDFSESPMMIFGGDIPGACSFLVCVLFLLAGFLLKTRRPCLVIQSSNHPVFDLLLIMESSILIMYAVSRSAHSDNLLSIGGSTAGVTRYVE
ncbi:hypothetical protein Tco_1343136 [Tanacetum coccineum]